MKIFYTILFNLLIINIVQSQKKDTVSKLILFPVIARSIETSWSFGGAASYTFRISKKDTLSRTSSFQGGAVYSLRKQLVSFVKGAQYFKGEQYIINEKISFSSFPDKFWGLGNNTTEQAEESYDFKQFYIYLNALKKIAPKLFIGLLYEYQKVWDMHYKAGGVFDKENIAGRTDYKVSGLGMSLAYDGRNHAFWPSRGLFAQLSFNHFGKYAGSDYTYTNYVVDVRKFIPVGRDVVALQGFIFANTGNQIPIRSLAAFGGAASMRGYYEGRYRDRHLFFLQGEYRMPLFWRFGIAGFVGIGNVTNTVRRISLAGLKIAAGVGGRFALSKDQKINLRIDYGIGQGVNSGLYFQLGEAF